MFPFFAVTSMFDMWYAVPLVVAVSLVYSATRYEDTASILGYAFRTAIWVVGFMAVVFLVFFFMSQQV